MECKPRNTLRLDPNVQGSYTGVRVSHRVKIWHRKRDLPDFIVSSDKFSKVFFLMPIVPPPDQVYLFLCEAYYKQCVENTGGMEVAHCIHSQSMHHLTLFRMGFFGVAHGCPKRPHLPKICHTYFVMMKLGTVIPYLRKIQKIYKSPDISLEFCWHFFHRNSDVDWVLIHNF